MAAVSQMIRTGIVELRSKAGSFYARPSPWERLYLVWTFRNFHALPKEVLNSRQRRLADKLCHSVDFTVRGPIIRFPIIGVIENAAPVLIAKTQALPAASNVVEMAATRAELDMPRAVAAGEISLRAASPAQNQPFLGTLARYVANVVDLPSAKEEPREPSNDEETRLALSDPETATPVGRRTVGWVLVAGCTMAALGLLVHFRSVRHVPAAMVAPAMAAVHEAPVPTRLPAPPETVLPSPRLAAKTPAVRPAPRPPLQLAAAKQLESQPSSSVIHVLPAVPAADSTTPVSTAAAPTAAPTAAPPAPPERLHIAEAPESGLKYPVAANRTLTGKVSLEAVIGEDGAVREVNILSGNRALAGAAARAVKLWRYRPYELNGHAVEAETQITFSFLGDDVVSVSFSR
ncbi:MAG: hypothetical protein DMG70_10120 [Acidobacteria bacterium]|nr:MAG: hypothetical protein DMG70_10120 [Acidobacteriota bacterium]